jgi:hypothetical protein
MSPGILATLWVRFIVRILLRCAAVGLFIYAAVQAAWGTAMGVADHGPGLIINPEGVVLYVLIPSFVPIIAGIAVLGVDRWLLPWLVPIPRRECPECGYAIEAYSRVCPECGLTLRNTLSPRPPADSSPNEKPAP